MHYASIRSLDISNGVGVGVSLFVQGCNFKCYNCFNSELWDFNQGNEWTDEIEDKFIGLIDRPYIKRISILGGEPLDDNNIDTVLHIIKRIKNNFPDKKIWLYSGYTWENIFPNIYTKELSTARATRLEIISLCDIMVDGQFVDSLKDLSLKFRGSKNQRIINIKQSLKSNSIVVENIDTQS